MLNNQLPLDTIIYCKTYLVLSTSLEHFDGCRMYDTEFDRLSKAEANEITRVTGCKKPCKYKKYKFIGERQETEFQSGEFTFSLWAVSELTMVQGGITCGAIEDRGGAIMLCSILIC